MASHKYDFYTMNHKAIRCRLFDLTARAGRLDPADLETLGALAVELSEACALLDEHAQREDTLLHPLLHKWAPEAGQRVEAQHLDLEPKTCALVGQLAELRAEEDPVVRRRKALAFYRGLARFVGDYLVHLSDEEEIVLPQILEKVPVEALAAVDEKFRAQVTPAELVRAARTILPALAPHERTGYLQLLRNAAPVSVLLDVEKAAEEALGPVAWKRLSSAACS